MTAFKDSTLAKAIKKYEYSIFLVLSGLLGLTPLSWFHGKLIAGEEFYALNYAKWIEVFGKAWSPYLNYGESSILIPLKVQGFFFFIFDHMGLSAYISQIIWYVFLWVLTAVVFYLFLEKVFEKSVSGFALFVGTIYYVYNPFFLNISPFLTPPRIVFIALPLILSVLYTVFKQTVVSSKEMFNFSLIIFLTSPVFVNLPAGIALIAVIVLGLVYKYVVLDRNYKNFLISFAYLTVFCTVVSLWWLVPVMRETFSKTDSIKMTSSSFTAVTSSHINDVLSQFGSWAFREKIYGYDYYYFPYYKAYDTFPLVFLRYVPLIFILFGIYHLITSLRSKLSNTLDLTTPRDDFLIFILFIFCIFTFLSKGASGILGRVYEMMYLHLPFFWIFREPYAKFMPVVSAASVPLILLGTIFVSKQLTSIKYAKNVILILLAVCFFAVGYPIWRGDVLWTINDRDVRSYEVKTPTYWEDLIAKWSPENGYYLLFPSNGMTDRYMWPSGYIGNPYLLFTNARTINPISSYILNQGSQRVIRYIYNKMFQDPKWVVSHAERYNLSGMIFQADTSSQMVEKRGFIKQNYKDVTKDFESAVFDKIDLYSFIGKDKNLTDFSVIPENKLLWISSSDIENYSLLKSLTPDAAYLVFGDDANKINSYLVSEDKKSLIADSLSETFILKDIKKDTYLGFIDDKHEFINSISGDASVLSSAAESGIRKFELILDSECCSYINLKIKPPTELGIAKDWMVLQQVDSQHYREGTLADTKLDVSTTSGIYYKKIADYDPSMQHLVTLQGKYVGRSGFSIFTVQRDTDITNETSLVGGVISQLDGQVSFTLQKADFLNSAVNAEYYVAVRKPELQGQAPESKDALDLSSMKFFRIYHPTILLVKKESYTDIENGAVMSAEQKRMDSSMVLAKVDVRAKDSYLQFKNAYSKGWRLIGLSEGDWLSADNSSGIGRAMLYYKIGLKAFWGKEPVNIEYYSNAWKLDTPNKVYAVVFLPEIEIKLLFIVAAAAVATGLVRKKW